MLSEIRKKNQAPQDHRNFMRKQTDTLATVKSEYGKQSGSILIEVCVEEWWHQPDKVERSEFWADTIYLLPLNTLVFHLNQMPSFL